MRRKSVPAQVIGLYLFRLSAQGGVSWHASTHGWIQRLIHQFNIYQNGETRMIFSSRPWITIRRSSLFSLLLPANVDTIFESIEHLQHNRPDNLQPPLHGNVEVFRDKGGSLLWGKYWAEPPPVGPSAGLYRSKPSSWTSNTSTVCSTQVCASKYHLVYSERRGDQIKACTSQPSFMQLAWCAGRWRSWKASSSVMSKAHQVQDLLFPPATSFNSKLNLHKLLQIVSYQRIYR